MEMKTTRNTTQHSIKLQQQQKQQRNRLIWITWNQLLTIIFRASCKFVIFGVFVFEYLCMCVRIVCECMWERVFVLKYKEKDGEKS